VSPVYWLLAHPEVAALLAAVAIAIGVAALVENLRRVSR
jgi:hypothetical protein